MQRKAKMRQSFVRKDEIELPVSRALLRSAFIKSATSERLSDAEGVPHAEYAQYYARVGSFPRIALAVSGHIAVTRTGRAESGQIFLTQRDLQHSTLKVRNLKRAVRAFRASADGASNSAAVVANMDDAQLNGAAGPFELFSAVPAAASTVNANLRNQQYMYGIEYPRPLFLAQLSHGGPQIPRYMHEQPVGFRRVPKAFYMFKRPREPTGNFSVDFARAAQTCMRCGFDGVQLNCAHGWLLHDLIRNGKHEMAADVVREVRNALPYAVVAVKVCGGAETLQFLEAIQYIVDFVEVSAGDFVEPQKMVFNHARRYAEEFAAQLKALTPPYKIVATGGFYNLQEAQASIDIGNCDMAGFGRLFCQPEPTEVIRLRQNAPALRLMRWCGKFSPLMNAGAQVVFYYETLRGVAGGRIKTNEYAARRMTLFWYFFSMATYFFGYVRYATRREWRK